MIRQYNKPLEKENKLRSSSKPIKGTAALHTDRIVNASGKKGTP